MNSQLYTILYQNTEDTLKFKKHWNLQCQLLAVEYTRTVNTHTKKKQQQQQNTHIPKKGNVSNFKSMFLHT